MAGRLQCQCSQARRTVPALQSVNLSPDPQEPRMARNEDWYAEQRELIAEEREERARHVCRCGGDMPGTCPGPAFCPMEQDADDDETP